jgi:hypothetical protein
MGKCCCYLFRLTPFDILCTSCAQLSFLHININHLTLSLLFFLYRYSHQAVEVGLKTITRLVMIMTMTGVVVVTQEIGHTILHSPIHPLHPRLRSKAMEDGLMMMTMMIPGSHQARIIQVHPGVVHTHRASLVNGRVAVVVDGEATLPEIGRRHSTLHILFLLHRLHHLNSPVPVHLMHQLSGMMTGKSTA